MWLTVALCIVAKAIAVEIATDDTILPTKTVYGFLDFTTTVSNTVMVFKPQSKATDKVLKKADSPAVAFKKSNKPNKKKVHSSTMADTSESLTLIESSLTSTEVNDAHLATDAIETGRAADSAGKAKLSVYKLKDVLEPIGMQQALVSKQKPLQEDPNQKFGLISKYGGTVIKNGVTTVHETSVIGTYLEGKYAQIKSSASSVFKAETVEAVPAKRGSAQAVLEDNPKIRPNIIHAAIAVTAAPVLTKSKNDDVNLPLESLFGLTQVETTTSRKPWKPTTKPQAPKPSHHTSKVSAHEDFLNRLQRHRQEQTSHEDPDVSASVTSKSVVKPSFRFSSGKRSTVPSTETTTETTSVSTEEKPRYTRRAGYVVSKKRNQRVENDIPASSESPRAVSVRKLQNTGERWRYLSSPKPVINIQGKNRFQQHRESLTTEPTTTTPKYEEYDDEAYNNYSNQEPLSIPEKQEYYDSYEEQQETQQETKQEEWPVEPTVVTLYLQTVTPSGYSDIYLEIATVKSPQVMRVGNSRSTRYLTVTKTSTRHSPKTVTPATPSYEEESEVEEVIQPTSPYSEEIPYTEAPYLTLEESQREPEPALEEPSLVESDYVTESATSDAAGPSMSTITETFSTVELMTKTSVVQFVKGKISTDITLTQSFYITRVVTAVKSVPAELFNGNIDETPLDEAGTVNHGRLVNGELQFPDDYEDQAPNQKRVQRHPYSTKSDLSEIGNDFDPSGYERYELEPSIIDTSALLVEPTPALDPRTQFSEVSTTIEATPVSPYQDQSGLTPEQMQQLALMRYMNPYAAFNPFMNLNPIGFGVPGINPVLPQYTSRSIVRTSDIIRTDLVPVWNGVSTIYSTLTRKMGVTTLTDYETVTNTPAANGNPFLQYTVTSSPVTVETITTSTNYRTYRIIFRAQTTVTTVTSTTVFPTVMTSYVTTSVPVQPSFPGIFPGIGGGAFPGYLG